MKLRTQLVLAFLLLAVVPLGGVTLYSYQSSERAFRRAVEAEAATMAEEMKGAMAHVSADLDRRLARLGDLPFAALLGGGEDRKAELLEKLQAEMGDASELVDTLEYVPDVPAPTISPAPASSPAPGAAPTPPRAPRSGHRPSAVPPLPTAPGAGSPHPHARAMRRIIVAPRPPADRSRGGAEKWVVRERELPDIPIPELPEVDPSLDPAVRAQMQAAYEQARKGAEQARAEVAKARALERKNIEEAKRQERQNLEEATRDREQDRLDRDQERLEREQDAKEQQRDAKEQEREEAARKERALKLDRQFGSMVKKDGTTVGRIHAQVRSQALLHEVLTRIGHREGEIPFAVDANGKVYTPESADRANVESLARMAGAASGADTTLRASDDWVVVTRKDAPSGLTLGVARPVGEGLKEIRRTAVRNLGYGLGMVAVALLGILPLSSRMTRNLSVLSDGAERLAKGDLEARVPVRSADEFGRLAETFNRMAADLRHNQERMLEQERLRKELEMCRRIQEEMLPRQPLKFPFAEVKGLSIPAREVGGDFFNYFGLEGGQAALLVGDVSGKGVPAALLMANLQATLRARLPFEGLAPLAEHLDHEIDEETPLGAYLTLFMGIVDGANAQFRYVNAGHNPPLVLSADGTLATLDATGRPLGLYPGGGYEEGHVALRPGDTLFLYTDGVVEAEDEAGQAFGVERLRSLLLAERAQGPDGILAAVEMALRTHRGHAEAMDDATLVALKLDEQATLEPGTSSEVG